LKNKKLKINRIKFKCWSLKKEMFFLGIKQCDILENEKLSLKSILILNLLICVGEE
jgi:hypothetical protein